MLIASDMLECLCVCQVIVFTVFLSPTLMLDSLRTFMDFSCTSNSPVFLGFQDPSHLLGPGLREMPRCRGQI